MKPMPPSIVALKNNYGAKKIERNGVIEIFLRDRIGGDQDLLLIHKICEEIIKLLKRSYSGLVLSNGEEYLSPISLRDVFIIIRILNSYANEDSELSFWGDSGLVVKVLVCANIEVIKWEIFNFLREQEFDIDDATFQYICEYPSELVDYF